MFDKMGFVYKLISLALIIVVLTLTVQACGEKKEDVSSIPSATVLETPTPTTTTFTPTAEPTTVPTPELTNTPEITPIASSTTLAVPTISVQDVKLKQDSDQNFVLVDVREKQLFDSSHIDSAISIPLEELSVRYIEISQGADIIVYSGCT